MNFKLRGRRRTAAYQLQQEFREFLDEQAKLHELHKAMREVELYESYVQMLRTIHLESDDPIDWTAVRTSSPAFTPGLPGPREMQAQLDYDNYRPSFWDRLFRRTEKERAGLRQRIDEAREGDLAEYQAWKDHVELAEGILLGDAKAYTDAVEKMKPFSDLSELGSDFTCYTSAASNLIIVEFRVNSDKIVPQEAKSLTKTGKLSLSKLPVTRYHSLEQDYVCSTIIRIARDIFALLPVDEVIIHATDYQLDEAIGKMELVTIVSVRIEKKVLESFNLAAIDPSEALKNFEHRMSFLKTKGFKPVEKLTV